ncbi:MAG: substrate-binding domain-containing protein, partial [Anaerolineae bacterium]|nr:substrate-binding domain-containing protein [Anaerolineae bacterium]
MKTLSRLVTLALLFALAFSIVGVNAQEGPTFEKKDPFKIGYSVYDMQQPYWQEYARGVQEAAEAAGAEFVLSDQKSSQETQVSGSLDLINQGISALVVSPVQPSALPAVVDAAHEAKIPVI